MSPDRAAGVGDWRRPADNRAALVAVAATGRVAPARLFPELLDRGRDGTVTILPGHGGVALGVHAGDAVERWLADHLTVGAAIEDADGSPAVPGPLHQLACVGNVVRDAAGRRLGVVAGKRGGLAPGFLPPNLVAVEAPDERLASLVPGDRVVVEALGRGLALLERPEVALLNLAPRALDALPLDEEGGRLRIAARAVVPSRAVGPGLGQDPWIGDLEIADPSALEPLVELRFGDLVAFGAVDGAGGRFHRPGYVAVGLVAHGPSPAAGHGVGVTLLLSGPEERLAVHVEAGASLARALRRWSAEPRA